MLGAGIKPEELNWFAENPCPPSVIGINHYLLSNRYLDEHKEKYPESTHGGNGRHEYADVEAVRASDAPVITPEVLMQEAWQRYQIPVAVTEVHIHATREDQMRWFKEIWTSAHIARDNGADVRAITAWGLLGHYDWHCLVSRCEGFYESGVFDLRGGTPRRTGLTTMIESLIKSGDYEHPILKVPGWWRRPERILFPAPPVSADATQTLVSSKLRPVLITGARGTLGRAFAQKCKQRGIPFRVLTREQMDITNPVSVETVLNEQRPWAIVNAAGYVRVDEAERDSDRCFRENVDGAAEPGACLCRSRTAVRHIFI